MRSGWPHTQDDHGRLPADQRQAPFGPEISWPTGYSDLEYRDGGYRYPAAQSAAGHGEHPYAAFSGAGYGDDGYSNPGYDGPASQDAGVAGTQTVRGFVEPAPAQAGYPQAGYAHPGYPQAGYPDQRYSEPTYSRPRPWDYDQPLHYDGDDAPYPAQDGYRPSGSYPQPDDYRQRPDGYGQPENYDEPDGYGFAGHPAPAYDPADYNGSAHSRPGIDGPGYDLSGIIGTGDFDTAGYDEPSYGRLSYDDPRYADATGHTDRRYDPQGGPRFDETRFDLPRFDETRLDSLWLADEDIRHDEPAGYGNDGFAGDGRLRSGYSDFDLSPSGRFDETRLDLRADDLRMDQTRFDMPAFDETRIDNMRALGPAADFRPSPTGLLAPSEDQPLSWAGETSLDDYLDLDEEVAPVPAAFVRTAERDDDKATRRATGRRRGRSRDRRQWMALGAIAVVAAGAIGGVLMKFVFSGPSGPAHNVVAPNRVDAFTRMPNLEKQMKVEALRQDVMKTSAGQATNVVSAVYQVGSTAPGGNAQIFMFVGGKLSSAAPATSLQNFTQTYPGAKVVPAGALGGEAACAEAQSNGEGVAMCVWFDNDSFGELVSPTMTTAKLASTLNTVRPSLELYAK
jgi:hypothetical protein